LPPVNGASLSPMNVENEIRGYWLESVLRTAYRCAGCPPAIIPWNLILEGEPLPCDARCDVCGARLGEGTGRAAGDASSTGTRRAASVG
jgi:hypothetical protein